MRQISSTRGGQLWGNGLSTQNMVFELEADLLQGFYLETPHIPPDIAFPYKATFCTRAVQFLTGFFGVPVVRELCFKVDAGNGGQHS